MIINKMNSFSELEEELSDMLEFKTPCLAENLFEVLLKLVTTSNIDKQGTILKPIN